MSKNKVKPVRMQHRFWLDVSRDEENELDAYALKLKEQRSFVTTIRDGLRLIRDLREQRLDVLFSLFPFVHSWLEERAQTIAQAMKDTPGSDENSGGGGLDTINEKISRLEQLLIAQNTNQGGGLLLAAKEASAAPKLLPPGTFRYADDDEIDLEIKRATIGADYNPSFNFMISVAAATGDYQNLPPDILAYGMRKGLIPADSVTAASPRTIAEKQPKTRAKGKGKPTTNNPLAALPALATGGNAKALAGADQLLAAPSFDDDIEIGF